MENLIHLYKTFEKVVYLDKKINNREFEGCIFKNCDFSNSDFSYNIFSDCEFIDCNLSVTRLSGSSMKNGSFKNCKLLGILFNECDDFLFGVHFSECILDYSSFANKKMPKTKFLHSSLKDVVFIGAKLMGSTFDNCDLAGAIFNETELKEVDFLTAYNYTIDPEFNPMRRAKFSTQGIPGLLEKYDIKIQ